MAATTTPAAPPQLTVLSYGAGQDSTTLLRLYLHREKFRTDYAPGDFLVLMSDTGNEHPETYQHVQETVALCADHGIEFHLIGEAAGCHSAAWPSLTGAWARKDLVGSKAFPKTCSDNLKIRPLYKFLNGWVGRKYGFTGADAADHGKQALVNYTERWGRIQVLIGIAKGEEKRVKKADDGRVGQLPLPFGPVKRTHQPGWLSRCIQRLYPLIDLGLDRAGCQAFLREVGASVPLPSNCMFCPFASEVELLWLSLAYPERLAEWEGFERRKLEVNAAQGQRNLTVWGNQEPLGAVLARARVKYADWSQERLFAYRMSHGHCTMSKF